jgi:hypothetical protein
VLGSTNGIIGTAGQLSPAWAAALKWIPIVGWIITGVMKSMSLYGSGWASRATATWA